jgi:siroheme synthase-like protein
MKNHHRYPVFFDLRDMPCLVVGGGVIASRKVASLLEAGARVRVVSPEVAPKLATLARRKTIELVPRGYARSDMRGMRMVIAATNDATVNHRVYRDAESRGIPVNVVDDLDYCRFVAPARFTAGSIEVAVTTGGAAPTIAKVVRDEVERVIGDRFTHLVDVLSTKRARIKRLPHATKAAFWNDMDALARGTARATPTRPHHIERSVTEALTNAERNAR